MTITEPTVDVTKPTTHYPGTPEKIKVLEERASRKLPLWVKGDASLDMGAVITMLENIFGNK